MFNICGSIFVNSKDFAVSMTRVNFLLLIGRLWNLIPNMKVCVLNVEQKSSRILGKKSSHILHHQKFNANICIQHFFLCVNTYFIFKNNNCVSTQHTCQNMKA